MGVFSRSRHYPFFNISHKLSPVMYTEREIETDRQTERQREKERETETDRDRQTDRQTEERGCAKMVCFSQSSFCTIKSYVMLHNTKELL